MKKNRFLQPKSPLFLSVLIFALTGNCHGPNTHSNTSPKNGSRAQLTRTAPPTQTAQPIFGYGSPLLLQYDQWLATLDSQKIINSYLALQKFQQLFAQQSPTICDTAYYLFDRFHGKIANYQENTPRNDSVDLEPLVPAARGVKTKPPSPLLRKIGDTLALSGLRVYEEEGVAHLTCDLSFINKHFSKHVSPEMKEFLAQQEKEDKEGFEDDAALLITTTQLAERAIWWEQFVQRQPKFIYTQVARDNHDFYLRILLQGMDNSPVIQDDHLTNEYATAYTYISTKYPQSETSAVISPWFKALQIKDTTTLNRIKKKYVPKLP